MLATCVFAREGHRLFATRVGDGLSRKELIAIDVVDK